MLHYLKGHPGQGILLRSDSNLALTAFSDSDWASCPLTRHSVTGYFILLGGSPVSWRSKKQNTVSRSSAETEYRAMANACNEIRWLRGLLVALYVPCVVTPKLYCDNKSALFIAANPVFHERSKHIDIDCHIVRECIQRNHIVTAYVPTRFQTADIFTKALPGPLFHSLLSKLGIFDIHAPT